MTPSAQKPSLLSMTDGAVLLQLERGWRASVSMIDAHTGRVTLLPPGQLSRATHLGARPERRISARRLLSATRLFTA